MCSAAVCRTSPAELDSHLLRCVEHARELVAREWDSRPAAMARRAAEVELAVRGALDVCKEALDHYDAKDGSMLPLEEQIADVAFVGIAELRNKLARVEALGSGATAAESAALEEACESSLRRVEKSLVALHLALAAGAQSPPRLSFGTRVASSLEVREQYARLRRTIRACTTPADLAATRRVLATAQVALMLATGRASFDTLRAADRRRFRELERRVDAWCARGHAQPDGAEVGRRIWQDLLGFADLLAEVSHRQELVEHDTATVESLHEALTPPDVTSVPHALREVARTLGGRDDELELVIESEDWTRATWQPLVRRLHRRLLAPETGRFVFSTPPSGVRTRG